MLLRSGADFSICRRWRYRLWREWDDQLPVLNFIMLNPSTADETTNDATVERCYRRAVMQRYGKLIVTNLFAYRATDPDVMKAAEDPVGPDNDAQILAAADEAGVIICAWGVDGGFRDRAKHVVSLLVEKNYRLAALALTKDGHPKHPLYCPYNDPLVSYVGVRASPS